MRAQSQLTHPTNVCKLSDLPELAHPVGAKREGQRTQGLPIIVDQPHLLLRPQPRHKIGVGVFASRAERLSRYDHTQRARERDAREVAQLKAVAQ